MSFFERVDNSLCDNCGKKMMFNPYKEDGKWVRRWYCKEGCGLMQYEKKLSEAKKK